MITIDFYLAIALYVLLSVAGLTVLWLSGKRQKERHLSLDPRFIWYCSVCTYTFINTKEGEISVCPRCGSYNKR